MRWSAELAIISRRRSNHDASHSRNPSTSPSTEGTRWPDKSVLSKRPESTNPAVARTQDDVRIARRSKAATDSLIVDAKRNGRETLFACSISRRKPELGFLLLNKIDLLADKQIAAAIAHFRRCMISGNRPDLRAQRKGLDELLACVLKALPWPTLFPRIRSPSPVAL